MKTENRLPADLATQLGVRRQAILLTLLLAVFSSCAPTGSGVSSGTPDVRPVANLDTGAFAVLLLEPMKRQFVLLDGSGRAVRTQDAGGTTTLPSISVSDDGRRVAYWRSAGSMYGAPFELVFWDLLTNDAKVLLRLTSERPWGRPVLSATGSFVAYATSTFEPPSPPDASKLRVFSIADGRERVVITDARAYPIMPLAFHGDELDTMQYTVDGARQLNMALDLATGRVLRKQTSDACRDVLLNYQSGALLCATRERDADPVEHHVWALSTFPDESLRQSDRDATAILWTGKTSILIGAPGPGSSYELRSHTFPRTAGSVLRTFDVPSAPVAVSPDGRWLLLAQTNFPGLAILDLTTASAPHSLEAPAEWRGAVPLGWVRRS